MAVEKFHDGPGEEVVAITGDHMSGAADVDETNLRKSGKKLVCSLFGDEIAHLASHKKHGHACAQNRFNRGVEAIDLGHFDGRTRRRAVNELRIPMPVPATVAMAQVGSKAVEIGWPASVGVVLLNHVSDFVQ